MTTQPALTATRSADTATDQDYANIEAIIAHELADLGCSYDLYTRTTTTNHYSVAQELFTQVWKNGYMVEQTTSGAISPSRVRIATTYGRASPTAIAWPMIGDSLR